MTIEEYKAKIGYTGPAKDYTPFIEKFAPGTVLTEKDIHDIEEVDDAFFDPAKDPECIAERKDEERRYGAHPGDVYRMTVDFSVLDHLGLNLYSNISAVLTEAVANAWDADAHEVHINLDVEDGQDTITISDDGCGMSIIDMNKKFLRVGYDRRAWEDWETPLGRPVMGRKGIGKLSLFSLADIVEVQSVREGMRHGLRMNVFDMRQRIDWKHGKSEVYHPEPLSDDEIVVEKGTIITLHKIKRHRLTKSFEVLRVQLARRFSVIGERFDFKVFINGVAVTVDDRDELRKAQFIWRIGESQVALPGGANVLEQYRISTDDSGMQSRPCGWIATVNKPKDLETKAGNLNGILVISHGRLIHENILDRLNDGRLFTKYLTGQIEVDDLDNDHIDVATSDRQRLIEDDPRVVNLIRYLKSVMGQIDHEWTEGRRKHEVEKVKREIPAVREWLEGVAPGGTRKNAEKMVAQITALPLESQDDTKTLLKHGIIAFERMRLRGSEGEFVQGVAQVERLLELLSDRDALEAELYADIVRSRLEAIRQISSLVDADKKERVLQEYLFDHLWLLDPTWERATGSERIEQSLKKEYRDFADDLTEDESKGRVDIRYKTSAGSHIVVELKRYGRLLTLPELLEQGEKYRSALFKCLSRQGKTTPDIQIVFVLGRPVAEQENPAFGPAYVSDSLQKLNARVVYYDEMIANAQKAYSEYSEKEKKISRLDKVLKEL